MHLQRKIATVKELRNNKKNPGRPTIWMYVGSEMQNICNCINANYFLIKLVMWKNKLLD